MCRRDPDQRRRQPESKHPQEADAPFLASSDFDGSLLDTGQRTNPALQSQDRAVVSRRATSGGERRRDKEAGRRWHSPCHLVSLSADVSLSPSGWFHGHDQSLVGELLRLKLGSFAVGDENDGTAAMMGLPHLVGGFGTWETGQFHD